MYGSGDPAVALPILLEHVAAGRLELAPLLGEVFPLEAIDEAVQADLELPPDGCSSSPSPARPLDGSRHLAVHRQAGRERVHGLFLKPAQVAVERERGGIRIVRFELLLVSSRP